MADSSANIESFLYHEAHLLDERRFEDWFALFTEDGYYWVPISADVVDPSQGLSISHDNLTSLRVRLRRLIEPFAHTEKPLRRACRLVSNIAVETDQNGAITVRSKLLMHEFRQREWARDEERIFAATVHHRLVRIGGDLRICWKRVDLINSESSLPLMPTPL